MDQVTLARALSKLGITSRSQARLLIARGEVTCDGVVERNPDRWVDLRRVKIAVAGTRTLQKERIYLKLHKPAGIVTTRRDERGRRTVYDLLPPGNPWVFPIGRLDLDSSGLLLLTNDTRLGEEITGPHGIAKEYEVTLDRTLGAAELKTMSAGMQLRDGTRLLQVTISRIARREPHTYRFVLVEGKNRQIRRMCEEVGAKVLRLHRTAIGDVRLGGLREGDAARFDPDDLGVRPRKKTGAESRQRHH